MNLLLLGLWTLDARVVVETLVWSLVAVREPPIPLWVVPRIVVVNQTFVVRFIGEEGETFVVVEPLSWFTPLQRDVLP